LSFINTIHWGNIRFLGLLLFSTVAAGCYSGGWHQSNTSQDNRVREDNRGNVESSESYRTTERDHGGDWQGERSSEQNSQGYLGDSH
jgi:hypothetical protein